MRQTFVWRVFCLAVTCIRSVDGFSQQGTVSSRPSSSRLQGTKDENSEISRRDVLTTASCATAAAATLLSFPTPSLAAASQDDVSFGASWSAIDGLNQMNDPNESNQVVGFDMSAYKAMKDDKSRTPLFERAIQQRLGNHPESQVVLDLGTGPFALFAIIAAQLGAGKVYAMEANPQAAASARALIAKQGWDDIIEVVEGFSKDIKLPEKVDFCIAEIVGSIASEEGAVATIADAHRFLKDPTASSSWIPCRIQTYAAPASYTLHNLFGPPEFDWTKLKGEPVRFNCRDYGLELLANPQLMEDFEFAKLNNAQGTQSKLSWTVDANRMQANLKPLLEEFKPGNDPKDADRLADETAHSFSGIALWPRLYLNDSDNDNLVIDSRQYGTGGHQKSHWQTVLPIVASRPIGNLQGGERIDIDYKFDLPSDSTKPPKYSIQGVVHYS